MSRSSLRTIGNIGAEGRKMDFTIIGDPVNTAARVEALTRKYGAEVLMTEHTAQRIRPLVDSAAIENATLLERGAVRVKGRAREVRIYELRGKAAESRQRARPANADKWRNAAD